MEAVRPQCEMKGHLNDSKDYNGGKSPTQPGWDHTVYAIYRVLDSISKNCLCLKGSIQGEMS